MAPIELLVGCVLCLRGLAFYSHMGILQIKEFSAPIRTNLICKLLNYHGFRDHYH